MQARTREFFLPVQYSLSMGTMAGTRKPSTPAVYRKQFIERVQICRKASELSPEEVAAKLGVLRDTYIRWETRALIPHDQIIPFCEAVAADIHVLLTGRPFSMGRELPRQQPIAPRKTSSQGS